MGVVGTCCRRVVVFLSSYRSSDNIYFFPLKPGSLCPNPSVFFCSTHEHWNVGNSQVTFGMVDKLRRLLITTVNSATVWQVVVRFIYWRNIFLSVRFTSGEIVESLLVCFLLDPVKSGEWSSFDKNIVACFFFLYFFPEWLQQPKKNFKKLIKIDFFFN